MSYLSIVLLLNLGIVYIKLTQSLPVGDPATSDGEKRSIVLKYLLKYGYLGDNSAPSDPSTPDAPASIVEPTDQNIRDAIACMQELGGLPVTGEADSSTLELMQLPRCGMFDADMCKKGRKKRYTTYGRGWTKTQLTWMVSAYTNDLPTTTVDSDLTDALKLWSDQTPLTFTQVKSGNADIAMRFANRSHNDEFPFDGRGGVLAHAFFPRDGDVHFDDDESWTSQSTRGTNFFQVALHELGHSLGLGHSKNTSAIMYAYYRGYTPGTVLGRDDILGVQSLYGARNGASGNTVRTTPRAIAFSTPPVTTTLVILGPRPPICIDGTIDAITEIAGDGIYIFKGSQYYKADNNGILPGYPQLISTRFPGIPNDLDSVMYWPGTTVNGIYEYPRVYFFKGNSVWRFETGAISQSYPKIISDEFRGIPSDIDAAFVWRGNGETYFVKGTSYWKYVRGQGIESGYPRDFTIAWGGIPARIADASSYSGSTYFFIKDSSDYYHFDDSNYRIVQPSPRSSIETLFKCSKFSNLVQKTQPFGRRNGP